VPHQAASAAVIARSLVDARLAVRALADYPGDKPADLGAAYAIQDAAIGLWPDEIAGWKIGLVAPELRQSAGADRIAGPIFKRQVLHVVGDEVADVPVFKGGFAAVEAEFALRISEDQSPTRRDWNERDAMAMIGAVHIGVELAGSPFAGINDFGPGVTVSDFGNNAGLVVGAEIADWKRIDWAKANAVASIEGTRVGEGNAAMLPGGPLAALAYILNHCVERGRPLREGQWISSGAVTGVHRIEAGQSAELWSGDFGALRCRAVAAQEEQTPAAARAGV
jgi:2-keto-4-pentenoate hydratase